MLNIGIMFGYVGIYLYICSVKLKNLNTMKRIAFLELMNFITDHHKDIKSFECHTHLNQDASFVVGLYDFAVFDAEFNILAESRPISKSKLSALISLTKVYSIPHFLDLPWFCK